MAGEWIKMRMDLLEDPAVYKLTSITKLDRLSIIGRLYAFWAWADKHAVDGRVDGATSTVVDDIARCDGFANALASVKWLEIGEDFISLPKHERHNGESAKERCMKNARQAKWRATKSTDVDGDASTSASTREEKRREDISTPNGVEAAQAAAPKQKRGSRLPDDWFLPQQWGQWALDKFPHFTVEIVRDEALKFANHWHSATGKSASKLDWYATWQNWCMSDICQRSHPPPGQTTETNYARQMRERVEEATGTLAHVVAAKAPGKQKLKPWEEAIENQNRTLALGLG